MYRLLFVLASVGAMTMVVLFGARFAFDSPLSPFYLPRWKSVGDQLERMLYVSETDKTEIVLYRFSSSEYSLRFIQDAERPLRLSDWAEKIAHETLVVNGVYFTETYNPAGSLIINGESLTTASYDLDKSGYLVLQPEFDLVNTKHETIDEQDVLEAGQSYPFLIWQGEAGVSKDSGLTARRTFIGQDTSGMIYIGVVPRDDVSLYHLAQILLETEVPWRSVLNLDGGPSTGLVAHQSEKSEIFDSATVVPNVIVVERRP